MPKSNEAKLPVVQSSAWGKQYISDRAQRDYQASSYNKSTKGKGSSHIEILPAERLL